MYCYRHPGRESRVSCSDCGRPICTDCMVVAPVGIRCPEHAGKAQGAARMTKGVRRVAYEGTGALVTKALIAVNVFVFLINLAQGSRINQVSGSLFAKWALWAPALASGEWYRLITATFLHAGIIPLGFNMFVLGYVGSSPEGDVPA